jgi:general secretion pathway protein D
VNPIDAMLAATTGGGNGAGSAALALAGALTDPQFQVLIRAINQRKGVDLLSSPSITARDQEEATIDIVREFRYPTEFLPPQIPTQITAAASTGSGGTSMPSIPVTPTTPSGFVPRETGVKLRVTPTIKGDNYAIDLDLHPEVTEFEGFINYGSPIRTTGTSSIYNSVTGTFGESFVSVVLTDNVINQPIFSVRKIHTAVTLLDGETIALGGLIREDVQKVEDKTPILGDIPLVGRLFRSKIDQHIKKNLTIFVTARIIDASGHPVKSSRLETEAEEVPPLARERDMPRAR